MKTYICKMKTEEGQKKYKELVNAGWKQLWSGYWKICMYKDI